MIDSNGICRIVVVSPFATLCCSVVLSVVPSTGWLGLIMTALLETVLPTVILHRIHLFFFFFFVAPGSVCQVEIPNFEQIYTDYGLYYICLVPL